MTDDRATRAYHSPIRARQKAATRQSIIEAAAAELASKGFTATTMRSIAGRAGVSIESVHILGQKHGLLLAALDQLANVAIPELSTDSELDQALNARDGERVVERLVDLYARWTEPSARLWLVASTESLGSDMIRQRLDLATAQRRADWQWVAGHVPDASPHLATALEVATSPETYLQVGVEGYASWLKHQVELLLRHRA